MSVDSLEELKQKLREEHPCYVLVTCSSPDDKGEIKVEMERQGDLVLASYILGGAQTLIEEELEGKSVPLRLVK